MVVLVALLALVGADTPTATGSPSQLRLTATGVEFTGPDGSLWVAGDFSGGSIVGDATPAPGATGPSAALYESARVGVDQLRTDLADGKYEVTLYFVELQPVQPGHRVFSVDVNGARVITDLDLAESAGVGQPVSRTVVATVENGELTLDFVASAGTPVVSGVEVHPVTDPSTPDAAAPTTPPASPAPSAPPTTAPATPGEDDVCATGSGADPATQPPATQPPATQPPATQPPATEPPATEPPATQPPAEATAGIPDGTTLTPHEGDLVVTEPGTVIDSMDIGGRLEIAANDVTVRNTLVRGGGQPDWVLEVPPGVTGALIENTEVGGGADGTTQTGAAAGILLGNNDSPNGVTTNVVRGVEIHHTIDGIRLDGNATVDSSWIHTLSFVGGVHSDGIQSTGWSHMLVRDNTVEGGTNDAVFFKTEPGNPAISCVTVEGNSLVGVSDQASGAVSSYGLGVVQGVEHISAIDNTFHGPFQVAAVSSGIDWRVWANNVLAGVGKISPS